MADNAPTGEPSPGVDMARTNDAAAEATTAPPVSAPADLSLDREQGTTAANDDDDDDDEAVQRFKVPEDLYNSLVGIGFSSNAVKKSIAAGCIDEKTCMQWLEMHLDHPELNTDLEPNVRVDITVKRVLTDEERAAKVAELKAKIAANKQLEKEQLLHKQADDARKRIATGKGALKLKEEREAIQRKLDYEQRRREKEEDRAAKEKLQFELAVDRAVRGGMDRLEAVKQVKLEMEAKRKQIEEEMQRRRQEHLDNERKAAEEAERRKAASSAAGSSGGGGGWSLEQLVLPSESELREQASSKGGGSGSGAAADAIVVDFDRDEAVVPSPSTANFTAILQRSAATLPKEDAKSVAGRNLLRRIVQAVVDAPLEPRVRTLKVSTSAFTTKLLPFPLSCLFLRQAGFQESSSSAQLRAAGVSDQLTLHVALLARLRSAVEALDSF